MIAKISVVIPLYNKETEIKRTLDSVLSQTFQNFEIIVVDDHSSDSGPAVVKSYQDPRISLIDQDHRGVSFTRNHGVDLATSDLIAFLDADDTWMPNHLEIINRLIEKYPEAGMYTTAYKIRSATGETRWANYRNIPNPPWEGLLPDYFKSGSLGDAPVNASGVVIPKKILYEMGGFIEGYWYGEDLDLFGKIALKYPVAFSWELGEIYHQDAFNRACDREIPLDYEYPFVKTARSALKKGVVPPQYKESVNEYIWRIELVQARSNVRAGHYQSAQILLKQCNTKWHYKEKMKWSLLSKIPYPIYTFIRDIRRKIIKTVQ